MRKSQDGGIFTDKYKIYDALLDGHARQSCWLDGSVEAYRTERRKDAVDVYSYYLKDNKESRW